MGPLGDPALIISGSGVLMIDRRAGSSRRYAALTNLYIGPVRFQRRLVSHPNFSVTFLVAMIAALMRMPRAWGPRDRAPVLDACAASLGNLVNHEPDNGPAEWDGRSSWAEAVTWRILL